MVSRLIGAKDLGRVGKAVHTAILAAFLFGILGGTVGFSVATPVLTLMGDEGHILALASKYCHIRFIGLPFLAVTNFSIAICRSKGDSTTPLIFMSISGLANILLNLLFVMVFGMDVDGVAWATVISNVISAVLLLFSLSKDEGPCRFSPKNLAIDKASLAEILRIGIPAGMQSVLYSISNMLIAKSIITVNNLQNPGGSAVLDGHSASQNIGTFATTCCEALELSYVSFTSQHCGAKKYKRLRTFIFDAYLTIVVFSIVLSSLIYIFRRPLLSLYVSDPAAFTVSDIRMSYMLLPYFICGCMSTGAQILRGMGKSTISALITLFFTCILRVLWIYTVFPQYMSLQSIYISYPLTWAIAAVAQAVGCYVCYRKMVKKDSLPTPVNQ